MTRATRRAIRLTDAAFAAAFFSWLFTLYSPLLTPILLAAMTLTGLATVLLRETRADHRRPR